jgi:Winged helix DNA-binding domain
VTGEELRRIRGARQRLHRPPGAPEDIVRQLLAVQAQDPRAVRLALRARGAGFGAADVDRALGDSLAITWLMRGTLHLVARADLPWLLALTARTRFATSRRRLAQEGVPPADAERAVEIVERALADGPATRAALADRLAAAGIRTAGQATPHLLMLAALRGVAVLVGDATFALARDVVGAAPAPRPDGLAELARRWLAAHGPATAADLAGWAGLPLRDARAGLAAIAGELVEVDGDLVDLANAGRSADPLPPRLLPAFDPYLLGWRDRGFAVAPEHARRVHPGGGIIRATVTVDGRVVGTWSQPRGRVELDLFEPADLEAEIADVERFAG